MPGARGDRTSERRPKIPPFCSKHTVVVSAAGLEVPERHVMPPRRIGNRVDLRETFRPNAPASGRTETCTRADQRRPRRPDGHTGHLTGRGSCHRLSARAAASPIPSSKPSTRPAASTNECRAQCVSPAAEVTATCTSTACRRAMRTGGIAGNATAAPSCRVARAGPHEHHCKAPRRHKGVDDPVRSRYRLGTGHHSASGRPDQPRARPCRQSV